MTNTTKKILIFFSITFLLLLTGCQKTPSARLQIGIIQPVDHPSLNEIRDGFVDELAELGYIDGETIEITYYNAQNESANYASMSQKLAKESNLIFAIATPAAQAVVAETQTVPIILGAVTDPVAAGLVQTMQAQDTNITGMSDQPPLNQQFTFLMAMQPGTKTIGVVYNSSEVNSFTQIRDFTNYADKANVEIVTKTVTTTNDVQTAMEALVGKVDAIYIPNDNTMASSMPSIRQIVLDNKIPLVPSALADAEIAGIGTVGMTQRAIGTQAAGQAADILSGNKKIEDMPIEVVSDVTLYINDENAQTVGISPEQIELVREQFKNI